MLGFELPEAKKNRHTGVMLKFWYILDTDANVFPITDL